MWDTLYDDGQVVIQVASAEAMLAMKLRANRPGRDDTDIAKLMAICDIDTLAAAEEPTKTSTPRRRCPIGRRAW